MSYSELNVITKAKELSKYIFVICEGAPKKYRLSLISRLQNLSLDIISKLYEANETFVEVRLLSDLRKTLDALKPNQAKNETEKYHLQEKALQLKLAHAQKYTERVGKRLDCSHRALTLVKELDHLVIVSREMQCITAKQQEYIAKLLFDLQNLIGAYIKSDRKRFNY